MSRVRIIPRQPPGPRWSDALVLAAVLVLLWVIAWPVLTMLP